MVGLPFKRTAKRRTAETSLQNGESRDDNPLDMFQMRQDHTWFLERERQATEHAIRQEKARRQRLAEEDKDIEDQLSRESSERRTSSIKGKQRDSERRGSKRRRLSSSSSEDDKPTSTSSVSRNSSQKSLQKSSHHTTKSPNRRRDNVAVKAKVLASRPSRPKSTLPAATQAISLDDSSDDYIRTPTKSRGKEKITVLSDDDDLSISAPAHHGSDDDDMIMAGSAVAQSADDDLGASYIREAQKRAKKRKEEQEAHDAREVAAADVIIESRLEGIPNLRIKIQINKKITLIRDAWQAQTKRKLEAATSEIRHDVVDGMFLTWRGVKLFDFYTLERLGISPDRHGLLYPTSRSTQEGFVGWSKVLFEAWTQELFDEHQADLKRERRLNLGELDDDPDGGLESQPQPEVEKKIKIFLRSKIYKEQKYSVQGSYTISKVKDVYRKASKVPTDKKIEIHFEGEILADNETIANLDLEDMDVLEIHIKDS